MADPQYRLAELDRALDLIESLLKADPSRRKAVADQLRQLEVKANEQYAVLLERFAGIVQLVQEFELRLKRLRGFVGEVGLPQIEVAFGNLPSAAADGIRVEHITDDVLLVARNIGKSNAYAVRVILQGGPELGGIVGANLKPDEVVSYPLKRVLGNRLKQTRRKIGFDSSPESLVLVFDVSYRSDVGQHGTTYRFVLDGSKKAGPLSV